MRKVNAEYECTFVLANNSQTIVAAFSDTPRARRGIADAAPLTALCVATGFLVASAAGSLAAGTITLDDTLLTNGLAAGAAGNWYSGTFGMEVWELNSASIPAGINLSPGPGSGVQGYAAMIAAGFVEEATFVGQTTAGPGWFGLGELVMWGGGPGGATVVLALAAWNTGDPSWSAMLAHANQSTLAGIVAFRQPTTPIAVNPGPAAPLAMDQDLVMTAIPEPSRLALAGLGWALLLGARGSRGLGRPDPSSGPPLA